MIKPEQQHYVIKDILAINCIYVQTVLQPILVCVCTAKTQPPTMAAGTEVEAVSILLNIY